MKRKLVIVDTETGGTDPSLHSLLSVAVLVWSDGAVIDEYYTLVNEGELVITEGALKVNGLTTAEVYEKGVSPIQAVNAITAMLQKHDLRRNVVLCAHNAQFDVGFMQRLWRLAGKDYHKTFQYRALCTLAGALLLDQAGVLSLPGNSASMDALTKLWSIKLEREGGHNALSDAHACAAVLAKEISLIRGR